MQARSNYNFEPLSPMSTMQGCTTVACLPTAAWRECKVWNTLLSSWRENSICTRCHSNVCSSFTHSCFIFFDQCDVHVHSCHATRTAFALDSLGKRLLPRFHCQQVSTSSHAYITLLLRLLQPLRTAETCHERVNPLPWNMQCDHGKPLARLPTSVIATATTS